MKTLHYCINCGIEISRWSKGRCKSCAGKERMIGKNIKGKNSPNWTGGLPHCIDCNKELSEYTTKRCKECYLKTIKGKNHPYFGKHHAEKSKRKKRNNHKKSKRYKGKNNPNYGKRYNWKNTIERHHIDLNRENNKKSNILLWTKTNHIRLHQTAYCYLVNKGIVRKYIKWFKKYKGLK
jgi:hypothetical protein